MAALSDNLLIIAIVGYTLAMVGYAAEYAFGRQGAVARIASRPRERELVGAGVGAAVGVGAGATEGIGTHGADGAGGVPDKPDVLPAAPRAYAGWFGQAAVVVTALSAGVHAAVLVTRGLAAHRVPWGNMYEFVVATALVGALAWLVLLAARPSVRPLGLGVALCLVLVLGFAGTVLYTKIAPLMPALNSYWLKIHVSAAATASGIFLLGFVPAALFLVRTGYDRGMRWFPMTLGARLPAAETLEGLTLRVHAFAFPIWTFAIICGAIWAEAAWGRYWGWDPKEVWSFISWVVYAGYLHARATPSVRRTTATGLAVLGWITMIINLYVINFVAVGLHSYAGVS